MSAIAGLYRFEDRPIERVEVERMLARLAHRGPDDAGAWVEGTVGLGAAVLRSTQESLQEKLPLVDETGNLALTADARLDNRDELIEALGPGRRLPDAVGDADLILRAYDAWGEDCSERLLGDFAFALWDRRRRTLFCARDPMGVRPLYYHRGPRLFAFASEPQAILCLPEVPRRLHEPRVAACFVPILDDPGVTFHDGVRRLPPGHSLSVRAGASPLRRYWALDPTREVRHGSDDDYAEAFREAFTRAVRGRLRSAVPVGAMLSGGLDSSSVVCVARSLAAEGERVPLPTFSAVFPGFAVCDERPFIDAVVAQGGLDPHYVRADDLDPLGAPDGLPWHEDGAFLDPSYYMRGALYRVARERGVRVILEGIGGDVVASHGVAHLHELARAGRWIAVGREAAALGRAFGTPAWPVVRDVARPLVPAPLRRAWRAVRHRHTPPWGQIVNPELARRIDLADRIEEERRRWLALGRRSRTDHWRRLVSRGLSDTLEALDGAAAAAGLELRDPFLDRRLVECCLAFPADQKLRRGSTRVAMRHAMGPLLPDEIRRRTGKADLGLMIPRALATFGRERLDAVMRTAPEIAGAYVDVGAVRRAYDHYVAAGARHDAMTVWRVVTLALWLRRAGFAP
jgi:asparagine synthase (glutamine-hydrolysing)